MRPLRLELEGFTSFRERTEIDFGDADYFVLAGPTGSGKSTIIDAICFALYGSVPRYGHKGLVAPVVTQGLLEAKVRLDFSIDGREYTAARVVRKTGNGATTREARLECDGKVLAGNADELTDRVTGLIGLSFDHFTKCVVLPQGEFARFLHDKPADRQDMLVRLLNLRVYERMRQTANTRAAQAKSAAEVMEQRLVDELAGATKEALKQARARVKELSRLRERISDTVPKLQDLSARSQEATAEADGARRWVEVLEALAIPDEVAAFGDDMAHAQKSLAEAEGIVRQAENAVATAVETRGALPERPPLADASAGHRRRVALADQLRGETAALEELEKKEAEAQTAFDKAATAHSKAVEAEAGARDEHMAAHLAGTLTAGRPCPVCLQPIRKVPKHGPVPALEKAQRALGRALAAKERAEDALRSAFGAGAEKRAEIAVLGEQLDALDRDLADHPDHEEVQRQLAAIDAADKELENTRTAETAARKEESAARAHLAELQKREREERRHFDEQRDGLAALGPPSAARDDLVADWEQLVSWAQQQIPSLGKRAGAAKARADKAAATYDALIDELACSCAECEVDIEDRDIVEAATASLAEARSEARDTEAAIETAGKLRARLKERRLEQKVAASLALHLSAKGFEKWIVNEALLRLVEGATTILKELSNDQYSLTVDTGGSFLVTDHHNANETRSARTLSGGETFLASLSLALALSDQLAELAARGSARLEAIFLDEGFGTLDPETLDTVEASIANLAATGRMVGLVTHVRELADRIPVQFKVAKDARTSSIEKVPV